MEYEKTATKAQFLPREIQPHENKSLNFVY